MPHLLYCNGAFYPEDQPVLRAQDRGFRYGDGVFETVRVHAGKLYQWPFHLARLRGGLAALHMQAETDDMEAICLDVLQKNAVTEGLLRIAISRGVGSRGYLPKTVTPTRIIEAMALPPAPSAPLRVWHSSYETVSAAALPVHYKLANGLASTLVRMEAAEQGCTEAIRLNAAGEVAETAGANVFWWKQDVLYTPALSCGVLEGSTRHAVLRLSPWKVEEGHWPLAVLREAEAVFITNVAMGVAPVAALLPEQWEWKKSVAIAEQIRDLVDQEMRDFCTHGF